MRILLVNTNRMKPPIAPVGLEYVASALDRARHQVALADLCLEPGALTTALDTDRFDLVALSFRNTDDCYFASKCSFVDILCRDVAAIRKHHAGPIAVGGGGFSVMPEALLEASGTDFGIVGDGEWALPGLLAALDGGSPMSDVPGLVYHNDNRWVRTAPVPGDPAELDLAARDFIDNRTYFQQGGQIGVETQRGCPGACIYCADPVIKGNRSRLRPPQHIVAELKNLLEQGADHVHFCDSEFNLPLRHAEDVCRAIDDAGLGEKIRWYAYACPRPFTEEFADLAVRSGCAGIDFGADHGSPEQLKALRRSFTPEDLAETARICKKYGIAFMYDLLLGAPGDTPARVQETIRLMKAIEPDCVGISLGVRVYPGTPLEKMLGKGVSTGLDPVYYLAPEFGPDPAGFVRDLIDGDPRFLMPAGEETQDYNYNDNQVLQDAIRQGYRGAYWDILRRLRS